MDSECGPTTPVATQEDDRLDRLIEAAREGSLEAIGRLAEECRNYLLLVANRELSVEYRARFAPSDAVQDTLLEAQRSFPRFRGSSRCELLGWLRRILLNKLIDVHRRQGRTGGRGGGREMPIDQLGSGVQRDDSALQESSPSGCAMAGEEVELMREALGELPEHYRTVIQLHHHQGLGFKDVALRMDRSVDAVRKLWWRALKQLQHQLEQLDEWR